MTPTPVVLAFLVTVAEQWGPEWGLALARAMRDGFVVELDGEKCLVKETATKQGGQLCIDI